MDWHAAKVRHWKVREKNEKNAMQRENGERFPTMPSTHKLMIFIANSCFESMWVTFTTLLVPP
jgi:hypothetical protein